MEGSTYENIENRRPVSLIRTEDPQALRLLAAVADIVGFPDPKKEGIADGNKIQGPEGSAAE